MLIVSAEPLDVARGSGTAVAVAELRRALAAVGVGAPVMRTSSLRHRGPSGVFAYDAILGVGGAGWRLAAASGIPCIALIKAFYAGAREHERGVARAVLSLRARAEQRGLGAADAVIAPSRFAAEAVTQVYGLDPARVHVVPEPFDAVAWQRALPAVARDPLRVLCVAHLYPRKRVIDLVHAWPAVLARVPQARLDIVGDGPELRHLVRASQGVSGCYLHGYVGRDAARQFYARAACFCLPSAQETFGYAAVEAMATGLPLVVADAGSLPEVCAGAMHEAVPVEAPAALAEAIVRALRDEAREVAARRNPERAAAFAPAAVAKRLLEIVDATRFGAQRRAGGSSSRSSGWRR